MAGHMIDGGLWVGRNPSTGCELTEAALIEHLRARNFQRAIVLSYKSLFYDYKSGNEEVVALYKRHPNQIIPAAIVAPHGFNIKQDLGYLEELSAAGVRTLAVYLAPQYYPLSLSSSVLRRIVDYCSELDFVVQFGIQNEQQLNEVATNFGHLSSPLLIKWTSGRGYMPVSEIIQCAENHENFYFDIGSITTCGGISHLISLLGAGRFFYASGIPESLPSTSRFLVDCAEIDQLAYQLVLGGTLSRIYQASHDHEMQHQIRPDDAGNLPDMLGVSKPAQAASAIIAAPKIDTHWHIDGWNLIEPRLDINSAQREFGKFNYQKVIVSSIEALNSDMVEGNQKLQRLIASDLSGRLYGYIVVDPMRPERSNEEIRRYSLDPRFVGVKTIQDLYSIDLASPRYQSILAEAERLSLPILAHKPGMKAAAEKFPGLIFICAHGTWERAQELLDLSNVYFDLATSHHDAAESQIQRLIDRVGDLRILFGSDGPLLSPAWTMGKLLDLQLTESAWENIFFKNALRIFSRLEDKVG